MPYSVSMGLHRAALNKMSSRTTGGRVTDVGYLAHVALSGLFGSNTPRPFRLTGTGKSVVRLDGYTDVDARELEQIAQNTADPDEYNSVVWSLLETKPLPISWRTGQLMGFEVLLHPIRQHRHKGGKRQERELFIAETYKRRRLGIRGPIDVQKLYADWLAEKVEFTGVARVLEAKVKRLFDQALFRRGQKKLVKRDRKRLVDMSGVLRIEDGDAFSGFLQHGIGREKALGFGMMHLRSL